MPLPKIGNKWSSAKRIELFPFLLERKKYPEYPACPAVPCDICNSNSEAHFTGVGPGDRTGALYPLSSAFCHLSSVVCLPS